VAVALSVLTISPWVVRNYLIFGRLIPVKSNVAYELYQSQCLTRDGVLRSNVFGSHPYCSDNEERWEYRRVGEMAYLDRKKDLFLQAVARDPLDFPERVVNRFLAATLVYTPFESGEENRRPWTFWTCRILFPLPFVALVALLGTSPWRPLTRAQWVVIGVYLAYLLPYVLVSYYDRYKFPVFAAEVLLVVWAVARRPAPEPLGPEWLVIEGDDAAVWTGEPLEEDDVYEPAK
jgi:hypothetical protein